MHENNMIEQVAKREVDEKKKYPKKLIVKANQSV